MGEITTYFDVNESNLARRGKCDDMQCKVSEGLSLGERRGS